LVLSEAYLVIGGPQGSGLETSAQVLTVAFASRGYGVVANREYHSNIMGRHSYVVFTVNSRRLVGHLSAPFHVAAFMDAESVFTHFEEVSKGSIFVYDRDVEATPLEKVVSMEPARRARVERRLRELGVEPTVGGVVEHLRSRGVRVAGLSFRGILERLQSRYQVPRGRLRRFTSAIVAGAVAGALGLDAAALEEGFRYRFRRREHLVEPNVYTAMLAAEEVRGQAGSIDLEPGSLELGEALVVTGNEAVAIGKVIAGVRFQSYYPITPAQDESFYLEEHELLDAGGERLGSVVVLQTEDELAAIAAAIGAALTGARAATATSGPGYDLMVEGLSWAGISEVPVVVTLYQRGGPSTGMPTRGSQEDLLASLFAGHGEFPRIVLSSGDHEEALRDAVTAANLAEKYQLPVIHLLDKFLANTVKMIELPDPAGMRVERGVWEEEPGPDYRRFRLDAPTHPISPRAPLGGAVMWYTGVEHDEYGHVSEDPEMRMKMMEKRMEKLSLADREIPERGERAVLYPGGEKPSSIEMLILGWGSVKPVVLEAVERLRREGVAAAYLHLRYFQPFPARYVYALVKGVKEHGGKVVAVEHSYRAQASMVVEMNTGLIVPYKVVKYTGRPIYLHELLEALREIHAGKTGRVVLRFGE